jgi:hypothetical protein
MRRLRRILDAVTPRRVLAALLIGAFAREIVAVVLWLVGIGLDLRGSPALAALVAAGLRLGLEVAVIFLAARGLASLVGGRGDQDPACGSTGGPEEDLLGRVGGDGGDREEEEASRGGGDDHGPDEDI